MIALIDFDEQHCRADFPRPSVSYINKVYGLSNFLEFLIYIMFVVELAMTDYLSNYNIKIFITAAFRHHF